MTASQLILLVESTLASKLIVHTGMAIYRLDRTDCWKAKPVMLP